MSYELNNSVVLITLHVYTKNGILTRLLKLCIEGMFTRCQSLMGTSLSWDKACMRLVKTKVNEVK